ncbi:hypothetical protein LX36DRAFT_689194 [Colletotrichum falcatum]|nr:hypothetical protein LX36DRAFT_689194 [Colletotrichum falcatum]
MTANITSMGFQETNTVGNRYSKKISDKLAELAPMDELVKTKCDRQHRRFVCLHGDQQVTTTCSDCRVRVIEMAKIFLKTCPGDWDSGLGQYVFHSVRDTISNERASTDGMDVSSTISFRWKMAHLADRIVETLQLAVPSNTPCLLWSKREWQQDRKQRLGETAFDNKWDIVWRQFIDGRLMPRPSVKQGPEFTRFQQYLVAAVRESVSSQENSDELVKKILALTKKAKASDQELRQGLLEKHNAFGETFKSPEACFLQ